MHVAVRINYEDTQRWAQLLSSKDAETVVKTPHRQHYPQNLPRNKNPTHNPYSTIKHNCGNIAARQSNILPSVQCLTFATHILLKIIIDTLLVTIGAATLLPVIANSRSHVFDKRAGRDQGRWCSHLRSSLVRENWLGHFGHLVV
jgi:hypothetical protein